MSYFWGVAAEVIKVQNNSTLVKEGGWVGWG